MSSQGGRAHLSGDIVGGGLLRTSVLLGGPFRTSVLKGAGRAPNQGYLAAQRSGWPGHSSSENDTAPGLLKICQQEVSASPRDPFLVISSFLEIVNIVSVMVWADPCHSLS